MQQDGQLRVQVQHPTGEIKNVFFIKGMMYIGASLPVLIPTLFSWFPIFWRYAKGYFYATGVLFPIQGLLNALIYAGVLERFLKFTVSIVRSTNNYIRSKVNSISQQHES